MGVQSLLCDLCGGLFSSKSDWNVHLLGDSHQEVARERWKHILSSSEILEGSAVIFSSLPLTTESCLNVVKTFSSPVRDYVTDFVWWKEQPFLGVIQFESSRKLKEVFDVLLNGCDKTVDGNRLQLKPCSRILKLEWKTLLHPVLETPPVEVVDAVHEQIIHPSSVVPSPTSSLQAQWNTICLAIELPEYACNTALEVVNKLRRLYQLQPRKAKIILLRNYFLRLKSPHNQDKPNSETDEALLLFAYCPNLESPRQIISPCLQHVEFLAKEQFSKELPNFERARGSQYLSIPCYRLSRKAPRFLFNLMRKSVMIAEGYLSRMTSYLTLFDPRLQPVITLITYWAKAHNVKISEYIAPSRSYDHTTVPDAVPLQWMVILYFIREKLIPTVREILARPHEPLDVHDSQGAYHDIGFSTDSQFPNNWRKERCVSGVIDDAFICSVIALTRGFFKFYSFQLKNGLWILNPKDGELIKREGTRCGKSSLSQEEIKLLTSLEESEKRKHLLITNSRISMLHPLILTWRLSFCAKRWTQVTCSLMRETALRLEGYFGKDARLKGETLASVLSGGIHAVPQTNLNISVEDPLTKTGSGLPKRKRARMI